MPSACHSRRWALRVTVHRSSLEPGRWSCLWFYAKLGALVLFAFTAAAR